MLIKYKIEDLVVLALMFIAFFVLVLGEGYIMEIVMWMCLFILYCFNNKNKETDKDEKVVRWVIAVIIGSFVLLSVLHLKYDSYDTLERLYGITKCICLPYIMFLCLNRKKTKEYFFGFCVCIVSFINVVYILRYGLDIDIFPQFFIGSENIAGIFNLLIIPWLVYKKRYYISLLLSLLSIIVFGSGTYYLLGFFEIVVTLYIVYFKKNYPIRYLVKVFVTIIVLLFAIFLLWPLVYNHFDFSIDAISSRLHIWHYVGVRIEEKSLWDKLFGSGDIIIQLREKNQQSHNMVFDLILFDGVFGVCLYLVLILLTLKRYNILMQKCCSKTGILLLIIYTVVLLCGLYHPVLTACKGFAFLAGVAFTYYFYSLRKGSNTECSEFLSLNSEKKYIN